MAEENKEVQEGKIFAVMGYLGVLCIIPLLLKKDNKFALHHAKQGLVLLICGIAVAVLAWVPILGWVVAPIASVALLIAVVIGIIQSLAGNYWKCPLVYDIAKKIKI